jgi:hypothetical protein
MTPMRFRIYFSRDVGLPDGQVSEAARRALRGAAPELELEANSADDVRKSLALEPGRLSLASPARAPLVVGDVVIDADGLALQVSRTGWARLIY